MNRLTVSLLLLLGSASVGLAIHGIVEEKRVVPVVRLEGVVEDLTNVERRVVYLVEDLRFKPTPAEVCACSPAILPTISVNDIDK